MKKTSIFSVIMSIILFASCAWAEPNLGDSTSNINAPTSSKQQAQASQKNSQVVNLNTADETELTSIKGIGKKKAQEILEYRKQNGSFKDVNDLQNVKGIGAKMLARILKNNPDKLTVK
jgi:competence protein ComEA